jgi:hydrogenase large subunit
VAGAPGTDMSAATPELVTMSWDPITRIVGSLGIHAQIDFANRRVVACHCTSSIFRGYSIFMKGKDPRDAHFITSRICGICGDNHATCSVYAQNMAFGVKPPPLADWMINLAEAAEYMFDHNLFQENLVGVDFCERMVAETNPGVLERANATEAPHAETHGYRTIGDIMRALNPFQGAFYREALQMSRVAREMYSLIGGRHVHPSTLYAGGVGTVASIGVFTEYLARLMRYVEFVKKVVPLHDDLFDFFYEALPGYEEVGRRQVLLACGGSFQDPDVCDFDYRTMSRWGRAMFVTPGIVVDGALLTTDLVDINLGIRILLGRSFYDDWQDAETFVAADPLGNPIDQRHPWNQTTIPRPQRRDFADRYTWVMAPRWLHRDTGSLLALDTGGGPLARLWVTALAGLVDVGTLKATGHSVRITLPRSVTLPAVELEWKIPAWSNTLERNRARSYFQAYAAAAALHFLDRALAEVHAGRTRTWTEFTVPDEAIGCGFHEAVRGMLSHHLVIRRGKIANYHPYPPTPWNASPRDAHGTPGPYEDAVQGSPIFEENPPERFKGIDVMRTIRSFDPCLPCGVHLYGGGRVTRIEHSPMLGVATCAAR